MAKSAASFLPPSRRLNAALIAWGRGQEIHRVHDVAYLGNAFNLSRAGNARFSPINDASGAVIPTLYAGTTLDCALMETVFHDVPFKPGFKPISKSKMVSKVHTVLVPNSDLRLIDLSTIALRKLGIMRAHLIDTTKAHYPETRRWAEVLYTQYPDAQGLHWTSRQDDHAQAVVLFGSRVNSSHLIISGQSTPLLVEGDATAPTIDLAIRLGVTLVE